MLVYAAQAATYMLVMTHYKKKKPGHTDERLLTGSCVFDFTDPTTTAHAV